MGQIKAKTHLQKLAFLDSDKKESQHDIIQTWAYRNMKEIILNTVMLNSKSNFEISKVNWEHTVMYKNGNYKMVVGYIDLQTKIDGDFYFHDTKKFENTTREIFIEVKTKIPSLGELFRQIRAYQAYETSKREYIIIAPDDQHAEILREQGFHFYKYKDPNLLF